MTEPLELTTLFEPRYDIASAARMIGMRANTLHAWVRGAKGFEAVLELPPVANGRPYLSFVNLTEAFVLDAMRKRHGIVMPKIRTALRYVEDEMGVDHPLAFEDFTTDRVDLFIRTAGGHVNASKRGQLALADVHGELRRIEWSQRRPVAIFPVTHLTREHPEDRPIRISPLVAFGKPTINGTGIPTRILAERFIAGESFEALAEDYSISATSVQEAVRLSLSSRLSEFTFFTDECLGNKLVPNGLRALGLHVECHSTHFKPGTHDQDWLSAVGRRGWIVVTKDERIRFRPAEKAALLQERLRVIMFGSQGQTAEHMIADFERALPKLIGYFENATVPSIIIIRKGGKTEVPRESLSDPGSAHGC